jgi:hypothetical protein
MWPQTAVEGCLLVRRCRGMSRHLANRPRAPPLTHSGSLLWRKDSPPCFDFGVEPTLAAVRSVTVLFGRLALDVLC